MVVAARGVGDHGELQSEGAAVQPGGEVAEVDRPAVGDAGGGAKQPRFAAAAHREIRALLGPAAHAA